MDTFIAFIAFIALVKLFSGSSSTDATDRASTSSDERVVHNVGTLYDRSETPPPGQFGD